MTNLLTCSNASSRKSTEVLVLLLVTVSFSGQMIWAVNWLSVLSPIYNCSYSYFPSEHEPSGKRNLFELLIDCSNRKTDDPEVILREIDDLIRANESLFDQHMVKLTVQHTPLVDIPPSICRLSVLRSLEFHENGFVELSGSCILQLPQLNDFTAQQNPLVVIRTDDQSRDQIQNYNTSSIKSVNLDYNSLKRLPNNWFVRMPNLTTLSAVHNELFEIQDGLFDGLEHLNEIVLEDNEITTIGLGVFSAESGLHRLTSVKLSGNSLTAIDTWLFARGRLATTPTKSVNIDLSENSVSTFSNRMRWNVTCADLQTYMTVNLVQNNIEHVTDVINGWHLDWSTCNSTVVQVFMLDNPLKCDCIDYDYRKRFIGRQWLFVVDLCDVPLASLVCNVTQQCPESCRCFYRPSNTTLHVDCSSKNLSQVPFVVPPLPNSNVRYKIDLSANMQLQTIAFRKYFTDVSFFDASGSAVMSVDPDAMAQLLTSVDIIRLNANRLQTLPSHVSGLVDVVTTHLDLSSNPFRCLCDDRWMVDWLKKIAERLANAKNVLCQFPLNLNKKNILILTGDDVCADPFSQSIRLAVIISLSTFVGVISVMAVVVYVVRRCRLALFARYRFHPFDRDECLGEEMYYDVFLCCSQDDERPHGNRILELLESKGYEVCYEARNFAFGNNISHNLNNAIEHSRRTLCLVSDSFINNPVCMASFDMAFNHNVISLHSKRLIVLTMLNDPSETAIALHTDTATLRHYVRQFKCVKYDEGDWLDRLLYALPLKRILQRQASTQDLDRLVEEEDGAAVTDDLLIDCLSAVVRDFD